MYKFLTPLVIQAVSRGRPRESRARIGVGLVGTAACAAICLLGTLPAFAASAETDARTRLVPAGDLDFSRRAGRKTLRVRLQAAARAVCGRSASDITSRAAETLCLRTVAIKTDWLR